jgi:hypothetical protein
MTALAKRTASPVPVLQLTNFAELVQFSQIAAKSKLVPPEYRGQPESIMLAVQLGSELGLRPMQSIQNIAVIGSRPTVWGDALLALVLAHPDCEDVVETDDNGTAVCTVKRRSRAPVVRRFSTSDAKVAQLWGKAGPWSTYPDRMLQMRARGFALRDAFPDVLKGLIAAEEARDIPHHDGPTLEAVAEPAQVAAADLVAALVLRLGDALALALQRYSQRQQPDRAADADHPRGRGDLGAARSCAIVWHDFQTISAPPACESKAKGPR